MVYYGRCGGNGSGSAANPLVPNPLAQFGWFQHRPSTIRARLLGQHGPRFLE